MLRLVASVIVAGLLSAVAISHITSETRSLNIRATVTSSGGSIANIQLMRADEADFALLQNDIAYYAFNGITLEPFIGKPVKSMAGVFSIYPEAVHLIATHASGVKSVRDLKGKRVAVGPVGSATEQNA